MRFSVSLGAVFSGSSMLDAMRSSAACGYSASEFWGWWDLDIQAVQREKDALGMEIAALCTRFVSLVDPAERVRYLRGLEETIEVAKKLGCKRIISQVGNEMPGSSREKQAESIIHGLIAAVPLLEDAGILLVFEPLNTLVDHKGYFLWSSDEAFAIEAAVNSPSVKVLFDIYHQQIMEGHLISRIQQNIHRIGHFHAAGNPGRHELDCGEINYPEIFRAIEQAGYEGFVGLEYFPLKNPMEGLKRLSDRMKERS